MVAGGFEYGVEWWKTAGGSAHELLGASNSLDGRSSGFGRWWGLVGCSRESEGGGLVSELRHSLDGGGGGSGCRKWLFRLVVGVNGDGGSVMEARLLDSADWLEFQSRWRSSGVNYGGDDGSSGAQWWLFCSTVVYSVGC